MKSIYLTNSIISLPFLYASEKKLIPPGIELHICMKDYTILSLLESSCINGGVLSNESKPDKQFIPILSIKKIRSRYQYSLYSYKENIPSDSFIKKLNSGLSRAIDKLKNLSTAQENSFLKTCQINYGYSVEMEECKEFLTGQYEVKPGKIPKKRSTSKNTSYFHESFYNLFHNSNEALFIINGQNLKITDLNEKVLYETGYQRSELINKKLTFLFHNISKDKEVQHLLSNMENYIHNLEFKRKEGGVLEVDLFTYSEEIDGETVYILQMINNTEQNETRRLKHKFISNISHELRTPMTNIKGFLELISKDTSLNFSTNHRDMLDTIFKNINRMTQLINNLLEVEKNGKETQEQTELFNPIDVIQEIIQTYSPEADQKGLEVRQNLNAKNLIMEGNKLEFSKLVANIFTNAIKYTFEGYVEITFEQEVNNLCLITIEDSGIGIDPKYSIAVFERFFRIPDKNNKKIGGSGIGLSIAHDTAIKMNGEILIERPASNQGTRFLIYLPAKEKEKVFK